MKDSKSGTTVGTDWTGLLADADLSRNIGKLLQIYRDAPPERREQALLLAMREIKQACSSSTEPPPPPHTATSATPPFETDSFGSDWEQDRRRYPRMKCFVAVELRVDEGEVPIWGNLCNTSAGGCQVETATHIRAGARVEVGLWVASGKIWVKGVALNGVVTRSSAPGVRVRFSGLGPVGKESLRQFLKYVQETTKASRRETSYVNLLK
jgi:hypothetical protein